MFPTGPSARASVVTIGVVVLAPASACTLLSGWGDLQGGGRGGPDGAIQDAPTDAGGGGDGDANGGGDTSTDASGSPSCVKTCAGEKCCFSLQTHETSCASVCDSGFSTLGCVDARDCNGQICCSIFGAGGFRTACVPSCAPGDMQLCDPKDPNSCPPTDSCTSDQQFAPWVCQ